MQKQYHGGALRISKFAHVINARILGGHGIVEALSQVVHAPDFPYKDERAFILLAEMTSEGSLATENYTVQSIELARKHTSAIIDFVVSRSLQDIPALSSATETEDFLVFTTGVNQSSKGDKLDQQYQTPTSAIEGGADSIISGRGVYAAKSRVEAVLSYKREGWKAYSKRANRD
jgi:orotidine-5'-phosphate decarboxylase